MMAVGLGLISLFPFSTGMSVALEKFLLANLLPDKAGAVIAKYLGLFAHRADSVTLIGVAALAITALMQMLTIEHTFNAIWKIKTKRPFLRRVAMHLIALLFGPLAFGASLAFITFIAGVSFGLVDEPGWVGVAFYKALPVAFMAALFGLLYWAVPNRAVASWHAAMGGVLAAFGFLALHRLFGFYIANFPVYTAIYGAFAAVPIFLVWLYLSWSVILVGALVVAELPAAARP